MTVGAAPAPAPPGPSAREPDLAGLNVVIIGGGLAGLAAALAIQQLNGRASVYERDLSFDDRRQGSLHEHRRQHSTFRVQIPFEQEATCCVAQPPPDWLVNQDLVNMLFLHRDLGVSK